MMSGRGNIFENVPAELPAELVEVLAESGGIRIERIVARGHASPEGFWYDQSENEWVVLLSGGAVIQFEGGRAVKMGPGDYINIPAHRRHRVVETAKDANSVWLAVHY